MALEEFGRSCVPISILPDDRIEGEEEFIVSIDSHPANVVLRQESTTVVIIDSTSEYNEVIVFSALRDGNNMLKYMPSSLNPMHIHCTCSICISFNTIFYSFMTVI